MRTPDQCLRERCPSPCAILLALAWFLAWLLASSNARADLVPAPPFGLSVARGFRVTQVADAAMAHDIRSLTFTPGGELAVSGPGYIRILHDANNDGVADDSTLFGTTETGASGMLFDEDELYCVSDGFLWRFLDADDNGVADGPPEKLFALPSGDAGAHALRKGPDGFLYLTVGHDSALLRGQIGEVAGRGGKPEAGMILRASPQGQNPVVIAHGFHNPVGFDFDSMGEMFTADSSVDADLELPWYQPSRLFHVAARGHHGWRVDDRQQCWSRPEYYFDTVDSAVELDRALPAGIACYRHTQFPAYFQEGIFVCDWAHGRVMFVRLNEDGPSVTGTSEVFLTANGAVGFAPNAVAVGPDGSLFVATGGRHARGSVFRVQYTGPRETGPAFRGVFTTELQKVLEAPQPLEAWSREEWVPIALRLGANVLANLAGDQRAAPGDRIRAIEILTEHFGGLIPALAADTAAANAPTVRARAAWSMGVHAPDNAIPLLLNLARDPAPLVRRVATESLLELAENLEPGVMQAAVAANITHPDRRLSLPATRLAAHLPEPAWTTFWEQANKSPTATRLPAILAHAWRQRGSTLNTPVIENALAVLRQTRNRDDQLDAVRLIILGLGDWRLKEPTAAAFTAFESAHSLSNDRELADLIEGVVLPLFPSDHAELDLELARLLAMLGGSRPETQGRLLARCTAKSAANSDFHHLTALACLRSPGLDKLANPLAAALLAVDRKQGGVDSAQQHWPARFSEVIQRLLPRSPELAGALVRQPDFARPAHLTIVDLLGAELQPSAARAFLAAVRADRQFPGSDELISLLSTLPPQETGAWFRQQWNTIGLHDRLLLEFAARPLSADADKFADGLLSTQPATIRACTTALLKLPATPESKALVPAMRLLRRLMFQPAEKALRERTVLLVSHLAGRQFKVAETGSDPDTLRNNHAAIFLWFANTHPALVRQLDADDGDEPAQWLVKVRGVDWSRGNPGRGERIYLASGCALCHDGAEPLGPDLVEATRRFSPRDLILSTVFPSREIGARWQSTQFRMRDGTRFGGLVVYAGNGVVIVQTGAATNIRLAESAIVDRWQGTASLMPAGLLRNLSQASLADLNAYLQTLGTNP